MIDCQAIIHIASRFLVGQEDGRLKNVILAAKVPKGAVALQRVAEHQSVHSLLVSELSKKADCLGQYLLPYNMSENKYYYSQNDYLPVGTGTVPTVYK